MINPALQFVMRGKQIRLERCFLVSLSSAFTVKIGIDISHSVLRRVENLEKFLTSVKEGKADAYVKSEPIPEKGDAVLIAAVVQKLGVLLSQQRSRYLSYSTHLGLLKLTC